MDRVLVLALVVACGHNKPADPVKQPGSAVPPAAEAVVTNDDGAKAQSGKSVAVKGTARDAKIGAAIVAEAGLVVYCLGVDSWPKDVSGKPITAHGKLEQTNEFAAKTSPTGEVSEGTEGSVWVLRSCEYDAR